MRKMEQEHKKAALEAILFAMGDSVELDRLAAARRLSGGVRGSFSDVYQRGSV